MTAPEEDAIESVARMIARGLGHNDDSGMHWERYILPARIIVREASPIHWRSIASAVAAERERCAKICDGQSRWSSEFGAVCQACADAIRAEPGKTP